MLCKKKAKAKSTRSRKKCEPQIQCCINCGRDTIAEDGFCDACSDGSLIGERRRLLAMTQQDALMIFGEAALKPLDDY